MILVNFFGLLVGMVCRCVGNLWLLMVCMLL